MLRTPVGQQPGVAMNGAAKSPVQEIAEECGACCKQYTSKLRKGLQHVTAVVEAVCSEPAARPELIWTHFEGSVRVLRRQRVINHCA
jgi:hypothetical protein